MRSAISFSSGPGTGASKTGHRPASPGFDAEANAKLCFTQEALLFSRSQNWMPNEA